MTAKKVAEEILRPHWKTTRSMDYWQEVERIVDIIEKHYPKVLRGGRSGASKRD